MPNKKLLQFSNARPWEINSGGSGKNRKRNEYEWLSKEILIGFHNSLTWWKERVNNHCDSIFIIYEAWNHIRPSNGSSLCVSMSAAEKVNPVGFSEIKCKPLKEKENGWGET